MNKNLEAKLNGVLNELGNWGSSDGREMPLFPGQVLTFIPGEEGVKTESFRGNKYGVFKTQQGFDIAFSQIARNGNGLNLKPGKRAEMVKEFADRIPDEDKGVYSVRVQDIKKLVSSFGNSDNKQTYYIFEEV